MSEFIFAIIGLIIGGTVGVLVMSILTVSKRADEDAGTPEVFLEAVRHFNQLQNRLIIWKCPHCKGVSTLKMYLEAGRCLYCGAISGGEGSVTIRWYGTSSGYYSEEVDFEEVKG